jgi:hypothetical protein
MITGFSPTPFWVPPPSPTLLTGTMKIETGFPSVADMPLGIDPKWWPLSPSIQAAICSPAGMVLAGGASGGGKSDYLVGDAMQEYWLPTFRGLLFRESLGEMDQLSDRMKYVYEPLGAIYRGRSGGGEFEFPIFDERTRRPMRRKGGARIRFGYLARDSDIGKYRGNQKSWIGIDESGMQPVKRVRAIMPWLAPTDPRLRPRIRFASNPGGVGASWQMPVFLRNRCPLHYPPSHLDNDVTRSVVPGKVYSGASWSWPPTPSELVHMTTAFFPATVADNPFYGEQKISVLRAQTPEIQMQLLYGCWCNAESLYFGFMNPERQAPRQLVRDEWWMNHVISIDYGFKNSSAAAGLYVTTESGQTFGIEEIVERQMGAVEYAKLIIERWVTPKLGGHPRRIEFVVMDPATDSHDDVGKSKFELMAEVFAEYGIISVKAHKDSSDNAQNLYAGLGSNMLVLTSGMPQTFRSVSTRVIDDRKAILKVHGDPLDDLIDSLLYFWNTFIRESKKPERLKLQESLDKMKQSGADATAMARRALMETRKIEEKEREKSKGLSLRRR